MICTSLAACAGVIFGTDVFVAHRANCSAGDGTASAPFCTVAQALAAAATGEIVRIAPGTYRERLVVSTGVTLVGEGGARVTVLDGEQSGTVLRTSPGTHLSIDGLTITGGLALDAGGILSQGRLTLSNTTMSENEAMFGASAVRHDSPEALDVQLCNIIRNGFFRTPKGPSSWKEAARGTYPSQSSTQTELIAQARSIRRSP